MNKANFFFLFLSCIAGASSCISNAPSPTTTSAPIYTAIIAPSPTPSPSPGNTSSPKPILTEVVLSSGGQLAFVQDGHLYIEKIPQSKEYIELGLYASHLSWSPDGTKLLFALSENPNSHSSSEIYLWDNNSASQIALAHLIPEFPAAEDFHHDFLPIGSWSPDSTKILFTDLIRPELLDLPIEEGTIAIVDLEKGTMMKRGYYEDYVTFLTPNRYLVQNHCGSPCEFLVVHEYPSGEIIASIDSTGQYAIAPSGEFLVNVGRVEPIQNPPRAVERIDAATGLISLLWDLPEDAFLPAVGPPPSISPDGEQIAFNMVSNDLGWGLSILNPQGVLQTFLPDSELLAWRPGGGLVVVEHVDGAPSSENHDRVRFVYWDLMHSSSVVLTQPEALVVDIPFWFDTGDNTFTADHWSNDGSYFVFNMLNTEEGTSALYLWDHGLESLKLISSTNIGKPYSYFWMPDSTNLYYSLALSNTSRELWQYVVDSGEHHLIAPLDLNG